MFILPQTPLLWGTATREALRPLNGLRAAEVCAAAAPSKEREGNGFLFLTPDNQFSKQDQSQRDPVAQSDDFPL